MAPLMTLTILVGAVKTCCLSMFVHILKLLRGESSHHIVLDPAFPFLLICLFERLRFLCVEKAWVQLLAIGLID